MLIINTIIIQFNIECFCQRINKRSMHLIEIALSVESTGSHDLRDGGSGYK